MVETENQTNPLATVSLILGLVGVAGFLFFFFCLGACIPFGGFVWAITLPLGIAALVTGMMARKKAKTISGTGEETGLAGFVCGIVVISYNVFIIVTVIVLFAIGTAAVLSEQLKEAWN